MYSVTLQFPSLDELLEALRTLDGAQVRPANTSEPAAKAAPSHASEPAAKAARASKPAKAATPEPTPDPEPAPAPAAEAAPEYTYARLKAGVLAVSKMGKIADIKRLLKEEFGGKPNFTYLDVPADDPAADPAELVRATDLVEALLEDGGNA